MKNLIYYMSILLLLIVTGCQKEPVANFITDKTSYVGGETIYLTNLSTNAVDYRWEISDGQVNYSQDIDYKTNLTTEGEITFKLIAYSKHYKKESTISKTVTVTPANGDATFWIMNGYITTVYLDGKSGTINTGYADTPDCGTSGCANFNNLDPGTYSYYATDNVHEWNGNITVYAGQCSTMRLYINKATPAKSPGSPKALK